MSLYYDPRTGKYLKESNSIEPFVSSDSPDDSDRQLNIYKELVQQDLNPALPPDSPHYDTKYADHRTPPGPGTPIVFPSRNNLYWPSQTNTNIDYSGITDSECTWSWDAKCLPKSSNYITDTSTKGTPGVNIDAPTGNHITDDAMEDLNLGDNLLTPNKVSDTILEAAGKAPFVFTTGDTQYIYEDPGYLRIVDSPASDDQVKLWTWNKAPESSDSEDAPIGVFTLANGLTQTQKEAIIGSSIPIIPGLTGNTVHMGPGDQELPAWKMVQILKRLSTQSKYWADMGRKNAMLYNVKTAIAASKYGEIEKANSLLRKQAGSSAGNDGKVERINSSIASQQRQVQIANDATRRRNENIFLLKLLLVYFLVVMIPLIGRRIFGDNFKAGHVVLVIVFISCPFLYILLWNLWSIRNRSSIRWPLRNWDLPLPPDNDVIQEEKPECYPPPICDAECEAEIVEIEDEIAADEREIAKCRKTIKQDKADEFKLENKLCRFKKKKKIPHTHCFSKKVTF